MGAVVELVITASDGDDLGEAIGEQMICLNARHWDDSDGTCERLLEWLRAPETRSPPAEPISLRDHCGLAGQSKLFSDRPSHNDQPASVGS